MKIIGANRLTKSAYAFSLAMAACAVFGAFAALAGWAFDLPLARSPLPGGVAMNPLTALAFALTGLSLGLLQEGRSPRLQRAGRVAGGIVALIGLVKLTDYSFGWSMSPDRLLFPGMLDDNVMAPNTAGFFFLTGSALALLDVQMRLGFRPAQGLVLVTAVGSFLSLLGYAFGASAFYVVSSYIPMAVNTAMLFQLLSLGILASRPVRGLMAVVTNPGIGGVSARRLLLAAVVVPVVCGWLRLLGERGGLYGAEFGVALMVACNVVIFAAITWWTGHALARLDGQRKQAAEALERSAAEIRDLYENSELRVAERTAELQRAAGEIEALNGQLRQRLIELAAINRDLEHKNQENETFVYSVSHDLRSPLVNLQGFSNELREVCGDLRTMIADHSLPADVQGRALDLIDKDAAESLRFIQTAVTRLSNIIDALLRLSRAGRVEYQFRTIDLAAVVESVTDSMRSTINDKEAVVSIGPLPHVWGDSIAVEQVFANLISNALKYLDPGRPSRIQVEWGGESPGDPQQHTFYVRDNGLGIPERQRAKAFQAFQRLHPNRAPGEGMGLAIVRRIVERHGGQIWIESAEGPGTTFCFTLPAPPHAGGESCRIATFSETERLEEHAGAIAADCLSGR